MDRIAQTFPTLAPAQIERIAAMGRRISVPAGEVLVEVGDQNTRFFVVLSGSVEIVQPMRGGEKVIVRHRAGQFTGELNMLSARRSLVRARAAEPSDVIAVDRDALRRLVQTDPELSEILMRAFILRRVALVEGGSDALVLIGSRHSGDTMRIKEFLSRNGQPFQYEDVETDPSSRRCSIGFTSA